jgi:hypothetical protein
MLPYIIFTAGFALIIAGWIVQMVKTLAKKNRGLSPVFLGLYGLGCVLLAAGGFWQNDLSTGIWNILCVASAGILFTTVLVQKKA